MIYYKRSVIIDISRLRFARVLYATHGKSRSSATRAAHAVHAVDLTADAGAPVNAHVK